MALCCAFADARVWGVFWICIGFTLTVRKLKFIDLLYREACGFGDVFSRSKENRAVISATAMMLIFIVDQTNNVFSSPEHLIEKVNEEIFIWLTAKNLFEGDIIERIDETSGLSISMSSVKHEY